MKKTITQRLLAVVSASVILLSFTQCTKSANDHNAMPTMEKRNANSLNLKKEYKVTLNPLNNSGVTGTAYLSLMGNMVTVTIEASGLEPNKLHPQHIHGFTESNKNSTCPTMAADTNGDGLVDLGEGLPSYGPVLLNLTPFPTADANGEVHYTQTFTIDPSLLPLQNRAIVLHGLTVGGVYMPTLPVACGQIQVWNQ